jgi:hypothetical protein
MKSSDGSLDKLSTTLIITHYKWSYISPRLLYEQIDHTGDDGEHDQDHDQDLHPVLLPHMSPPLEDRELSCLVPFVAVAAEVGDLCLAVLPLLVESWNLASVHHVPLRHLSIDMWYICYAIKGMTKCKHACMTTNTMARIHKPGIKHSMDDDRSYISKSNMDRQGMTSLGKLMFTHTSNNSSETTLGYIVKFTIHRHNTAS